MNFFKQTWARIFLIGMVMCTSALTGCAPGAPLIGKLSEEKITQITLVVEKDASRYSVPASASDQFVGGGIGVRLAGTLGATIGLERAHVALNEAAKSRGITSKHHDSFVNAFVDRMRREKINVVVVPATYVNTWGRERGLIHPVSSEVKALPTNYPSFYLSLDMGTCTLGVITPCIRSMLNSTGVVTAPGPQRYKGIVTFLPDVWKAVPPPKFASLDEAVGRIDEFDAEIARLAPLAAENMMSGLLKHSYPEHK